MVAVRRDRTIERVEEQTWHAERPLMVPVARRLVAPAEGLESVSPTPPIPSPARPGLAPAGETVDVRLLGA